MYLKRAIKPVYCVQNAIKSETVKIQQTCLRFSTKKKIMQLQSLIFNYAYFLLLLIKMCKTYQPNLYKSPILNPSNDPRFRHFKTYKENSTLPPPPLQHKQRVAIYYLPQPQTWPTATAAIDRYRNEGNFYGGAQANVAADKARTQATEQYVSRKRYVAPISLFDHRVYHADTWRSTEAPQYEYHHRQRRLDNDNLAIDQRNANDDQQQSERDLQQVHTNAVEQEDFKQEQPASPPHEKRAFHDIYMRVAGPNELNLFGHVEQGPHLYEQRFESQNKGNRYKGEVLWADNTGGYGKQSWDLAQGKL